MANNYTTNYPTTTEHSGDSVGGGNLPATYDIIVTPDTGYTVQASDFSIGSSLPAEVAQVVFTDTTVALDPTNKVRARVHLASWYIMPSTATSGYSGVVIEVDIDGVARRYQPRLSFNTVNTSVDNLVVTRSFSGTSTTVVDGNITTNVVYQNINQSTTAQVCQLTFTASEGYHIPNMPSFRLVSNDTSKWSHTKSGHVYSDNQLTEVVFTFNYSIGTQNINATNGESIIFTVADMVANPTSCTSIHSAYFLGLPNQSVLPAGNATLQLFVSGSENSTYNIKIEDSVERTYDFSSNDGTFSRSLTLSDTQTIYSPTEQILRGRSVGRNQHSITIPYLIEKDTSSVRSFTATITPTSGVFSNTNCVSTDPFVIILNQFGVVDLTVGTAASTYGVDTSTGIIKTLSNQPAISYPTIFNPTDLPTLNTSNNGFFSIADDLGYTVNGTVASHTHASASVVLTATSAALKLQTGDSVTGTGVDTATTITVDGTTTIVLSKTSLSTISGTLTFTRTVGISRQPVISDFDILTPLVQEGGWSYLTSVVTQTASNSATIQVDDTTGLAVGLTAQGNNIVGYPTITAFGSDNVILSTNQTLSTGDSLTFTPSMSEVHFSEMSVTGAGTSSCKLNVEGYIQRMGTSSVTGKLDLENFVTTYTGPTAAVVTVTCTHGQSIIIQPIPDCTGHTGTLSVNGKTRGNGTLTINDGGQEMIYTAPKSGTSDTNSYTVTDGVNTSAAANINITLTSY